MWLNPQFPADWVTFTEKIRNGKLHFFYSVILANVPWKFANEWTPYKRFVNEWTPYKHHINLKGLHITFWGTTKKCENKNLT